MYNQPVGPAAATGIGGAILFPELGLFWLLMLAVAAFALIGAVSAAMRTLPAMSFLYRQPKSLAPGKHRRTK